MGGKDRYKGKALTVDSFLVCELIGSRGQLEAFNFACAGVFGCPQIARLLIDNLERNRGSHHDVVARLIAQGGWNALAGGNANTLVRVSVEASADRIVVGPNLERGHGAIRRLRSSLEDIGPDIAGVASRDNGSSRKEAVVLGSPGLVFDRDFVGVHHFEGSRSSTKM